MNKIDEMRYLLNNLERKVQEAQHHVTVGEGHPDTQANDVIIALKQANSILLQALVTAGTIQGLESHDPA